MQQSSSSVGCACQGSAEGGPSVHRGVAHFLCRHSELRRTTYPRDGQGGFHRGAFLPARVPIGHYGRVERLTAQTRAKAVLEAAPASPKPTTPLRKDVVDAVRVSLTSEGFRLPAAMLDARAA